MAHLLESMGTTWVNDYLLGPIDSLGPISKHCTNSLPSMYSILSGRNRIGPEWRCTGLRTVLPCMWAIVAMETRVTVGQKGISSVIWRLSNWQRGEWHGKVPRRPNRCQLWQHGYQSVCASTCADDKGRLGGRIGAQPAACCREVMPPPAA